MMRYIFVPFLLLSFSSVTQAQGEDSTKYERDEMVISEFLPGLYSNYNQVYFNNRGKVPDEERHLRREIEVLEIETNIFSVKDTYVMANVFDKTITEDDKKTSYAIIDVADRVIMIDDADIIYDGSSDGMINSNIEIVSNFVSSAYANGVIK